MRRSVASPVWYRSNRTSCRSKWMAHSFIWSRFRR
jgi:hypothetical protein